MPIRIPLATGFMLLICVSPALPCTDFRVPVADGTSFTARSMEFGHGPQTHLVVQPRGATQASLAPGNKPGLAWKGKYGYVYLDAMGEAPATDGLNEAGLGFGALYLPGLAEYQTVGPDQQACALSNAYFGNWLLANFSTVDEVKAALPKVRVWGEPFAPMGGIVLPLHYAVHDAAGRSLVIEYVNGGELKVYDNNAVGVLTNCPTFAWHLFNVDNYLNLSASQPAPVKVGQHVFAANGNGAGLLGLPGDPTPPSRFIQTLAVLRFADQPQNATAALVLAQKTLNRVDIPIGLVRVNGTGEQLSDCTAWSVFRDHTNRQYYWRSYNDVTLRMVSLKKLDFKEGAPRRALVIDAEAPTVLEIPPEAIPVLAKP